MLVAHELLQLALSPFTHCLTNVCIMLLDANMHSRVDHGIALLCGLATLVDPLLVVDMYYKPVTVIDPLLDVDMCCKPVDSV